MICPKCKELGLKSKVYGGNVGFSTCAGWQPYYDEEGIHHSHNPNSNTSSLYCSNGHRIVISSSNKCVNCDYGHEETITVTDLPPNNFITTTNDINSVVIVDGSGMVLNRSKIE